MYNLSVHIRFDSHRLCLQRKLEIVSNQIENRRPWFAVNLFDIVAAFAWMFDLRSNRKHIFTYYGNKHPGCAFISNALRLCAKSLMLTIIYLVVWLVADVEWNFLFVSFLPSEFLCVALCKMILNHILFVRSSIGTWHAGGHRKEVPVCNHTIIHIA